MRIKKLAIAAAGSIALGTLSLVIANRAPAVGGSPFQESVPRNDKPLVRNVGPDGRAIGSLKAIARNRSVTQTYYVGDILGTEPRFLAGSTSVGDPARAATGVRASVDMRPITDLIAATVAPGTWRIGDMNSVVETSDTNVMVPFMLSISLIIRCPAEVHDQVGNTLRLLRALLQARDERTQPPPVEPTKSPQAVNSEPASPTGRFSLPSPIPAPADPTLPRAAARQVVPPPPATRQRVQQLLDELQKEVEKLPRDDN